MLHIKVALEVYLKTVGLYFQQFASKVLFKRLDATSKTRQVLTLLLDAIKYITNKTFMAQAFVNSSNILSMPMLQLSISDPSR